MLGVHTRTYVRMYVHARAVHDDLVMRLKGIHNYFSWMTVCVKVCLLCIWTFPFVCIQCMCECLHTYHVHASSSSDAIALRFLVSVSITTGKYERLRDAAARVLPFWEETSPSYPYIIAL